MGWLNRMIEARISPNILSYNAVLDGCAQVGDAEGVERWLRAMKERNIVPNTRSFTAALRCCARRGDPESALKWLDTMRSVGPDVVPNEIAYNSAIRSCANAKPKASEVAERLFQEMRANDLHPTVTTLSALGEAVGAGRRDVLCSAHGVDMDLVRERAARLQQQRAENDSGDEGDWLGRDAASGVRQIRLGRWRPPSV